MERRAFERNPQGGVDIDICFPCHAMWFDQFESAQLSPGAIVQLFRDINEHRDDPLKPISTSARCPRCRAGLALTHDIQRTNKITYYRCPQGHGRLTSFYMFLREKNFIRSLSAPEATQLRAQVKQVRCSSCGGPIDLERQMECPYCRAPVSILDPDAVRRTLLELDGKQRGAGALDAERLRQKVLAGGGPPQNVRGWTSTQPLTAPWVTALAGSSFLDGAVDLLSAALEQFVDDH